MDSAAQLLATIQNNADSRFPRRELEYLIAYPEESKPVLLHLLEDVIENFDAYYEDDTFIGHLYAFFLLAQFRERRAYTLITQFFSQYGDRAEKMCGDFVTEDLARVLASVFDGNLIPIIHLIENTKVNEWVRGSSVSSLTILALHDIVPHDEVIACFRELFTHKLEQDYAEVWNSLVVDAVNLYPSALKTEIRQASQSGFVDEFIISQSAIDEALSTTKEARLTQLRNNVHYTLITDTIAEMEWWAAFRDPTPKPNINSRPHLSFPQPTGIPSVPKPKIGRNAPCHCGSGKKYKKCCWPN